MEFERAQASLHAAELCLAHGLVDSAVNRAYFALFHIPPNYVVERVSCSSKTARGEDLQIEHPVWCGYSPAFHFHPTLTGMLGSTLIWHQIVQVCEPREKRLLASLRMMEPFHREQFPLDGVMGLVSKRAGRRHLGVCKDRIPAGFLVVKPASHALAVGRSSRGGDVVRKTAPSLAQRKYAQPFALSRPGQEGVKLRTQGLAHRRRDRRQLLRERVERVAETVAEACTRA